MDLASKESLLPPRLLDTEFTDFVRPGLISIALVAENGREFYAERTDYHRDALRCLCTGNCAALAGVDSK